MIKRLPSNVYIEFTVTCLFEYSIYLSPKIRVFVCLHAGYNYMDAHLLSTDIPHAVA